jgi:Domain of unknown function (DUF4167)
VCRAGQGASERIRRAVNNMKRMRGRNHRGGGGGGGIRHHASGNVPLNRNHVFDSQGPDLRLRGTAQQLFERYLQLGRDATSGGDRVMAESYFQYAEHYFRILGAMQAAQQQGQQGGQYAGHASGGQPNGYGGGQQGGHRRHQGEASAEYPDGEDGADDGGVIEQQLARREATDEPQSERALTERREIPIASAPPEG